MNHIWSYDFVFDRTEVAKPIKILPVMDEFIRKSFLYSRRSFDQERGPD
jgi:hypothetical protein